MPVSPMLALATEESSLAAKNWDGWMLEPKHDGMRAIVEITENGVEIYSRTGKSQKGKCPHLEYNLSLLPVGTILDGEIALVVNAVEVRGKKVPVVDFNKTMRIMGSGVDKALARQAEFGKPVFIVFDIIEYAGFDFRNEAQWARTNVINSLETNYLMHNPYYMDEFEETYTALVDAGVEGAILKNRYGLYEDGGRSKSWLKVKSAKTFDVIVTGYTEGQGKYTGQIGAMEFSAVDGDGSLVYVGRCSGMTDEFRKEVSAKRETGFVIEVKANEMVGSGEYRTPRHPQFVCVRVDKNPEDCSRDQFKA